MPVDMPESLPETTKRVLQMIERYLPFWDDGRFFISRGRLLKEGLDPEETYCSFNLLERLGVLDYYEKARATPFELYEDEELEILVPGDFEEHFYHSGKVDYDKFRAILSDNGLVPCQLLSDFLGDECVLKIGNVKIKLPPSGNEMDFCRVIYKYPVNKTVDWSEIYEEMTGDLSFERSESKKKKISDTARSLNRRVENNNFNALFSWQRKTVSRLY